MPASTMESPAVALSFANNFWGKDDAGVGPLLDRMAAAKQTCDELKAFYSVRASIEDEYSRKLLSLCRKSLGSNETGSLKTSLDTLRGEVESMGKQHQSIAAQMKTELEEPLAAFAGAMKERRKIVQNGIEKILKTKIQQTQHVNKTRDRFEQECLKIKGYLAQGHMVMGQEERKNKAKLEKTQISVATSNTEYENAVKALEDTTVRWNREWKAAADKFQDLEEERLDFTKSSLWTFANVSSTVCVSDDASCEKIRLSLEKMDVETDIVGFIKERGTGQEIPDPPKYINFCRGDITDTKSETSDDDNYSVAQFPRSINPAFRSSSPQPSTYESHHDPNSSLAQDLGHKEPAPAAPKSVAPEPVRKEASPSSVRHMALQDAGRKASPSSRSFAPDSGHKDASISSQNFLPDLGHKDAGPSPRHFLPDLGQRDAMPSPRNFVPGLGYKGPSPPSQIFLPDLGQKEASSSPRGYLHDVGHKEPTYSSRNYAHNVFSREIAPPPAREPKELGYSLRSYPQEFSPREIAPPAAREPKEPSHSLRGYPQDVSPREVAPPTAREPKEPSHSLRGYPQDVSPREVAPPTAREPKEPSHSLRGYPQDVSPREVAPPTAREPKEPSHSLRGYPQDVSPREVAPPTAREPLSLTRRMPPPLEKPRQVAPVAHQSPQQSSRPPLELSQHGTFASVPHDPYPLDGMTMLCRTGPAGPVSERSSQPPSARPSSRDSQSDYSNPTSLSSQEPLSGKVSPVKQDPIGAPAPAPAPVEKQVLKKKSGFFQNHSPFRRKSTKDVQGSPVNNRNTWHPVSAQGSPARRPQLQRQITPPTQTKQNLLADRSTISPEPIDANASLALNVGQNVFSVTNPDIEKRKAANTPSAAAETDPIALALAELKGIGVGKQSSVRVSADRYHGIATPTPGSQPFSRSVPAPSNNSAAPPGLRGAPPPSYDQQAVVQRLGVPQPAVTAKAMKETSQKFANQTRSMFDATNRPGSGYAGSSHSRPVTRGSSDVPRAASPAPLRAASPRAAPMEDSRNSCRGSPRSASPRVAPADDARSYRSTSPNPMSSSLGKGGSQMSSTPRRGSEQPYYRQNSPSTMSRTASPASYREKMRPTSSHTTNNMAIQLAPASNDSYGSVRSRGGSRPGTSSSNRPGTSSSNRAMGLYEDGGPPAQGESRQRSKSVADPARQYTSDGRPILHFARALYMYQAAIPEELGFSKGDYLAVLRHQDDGWWEAEVHGGSGQIGLVPSNYLQPC